MSDEGVRTEIFAAVLLATVAGMGAGTAYFVDWRPVKLQIEAERSQFAAQVRMERLQQKQDLMQRFASGIPRNINFMSRIVRDVNWLDLNSDTAGWEAGGEPVYWDQRPFSAVARDADALTNLLFEGENFLALCELSHVQFADDVDIAVGRVRALFDLMTEVRPREIAAQVEILRRLTADELFGSAYAASRSEVNGTGSIRLLGTDWYKQMSASIDKAERFAKSAEQFAQRARTRRHDAEQAEAQQAAALLEGAAADEAAAQESRGAAVYWIVHATEKAIEIAYFEALKRMGEEIESDQRTQIGDEPP